MPFVIPLVNHAGAGTFASINTRPDQVELLAAQAVQFGFRQVFNEVLKTGEPDITMKPLETVEWTLMKFTIIVLARWTPARDGKFDELKGVIQRNVRSWHDWLSDTEVFVNPSGDPCN